MSTVLVVVAWALSLILALPVLVFFVECIFGMFRTQSPVFAARFRPRIALVVPAHDEEQGIAATVSALSGELSPADRLLVIADNCTDATASEATSAGAEVLVRHDPARRGKGYALSFAFERLAAAPPDVVVVVDADCRVERGAIPHLAEVAAISGRPVQADYVLDAPVDAGPRSRVSAFAVLVRNRVRPRGLALLGLSCQLTGSGMALPWDAAISARPTEGNVVEDLALGLDLGCQGRPPLFCSGARVTSFLPSSDRAARTQRRRWEGGHLTTLLRHVPRVIFAGFMRRDVRLVALGLDLAVPPLALLVVLLVMATILGAAASVAGAGNSALIVALGELSLVAVAVMGAWFSEGRRVLSLRDAAAMPLYVFWKVALYVGLLRGGTDKDWVRTERGA
jgi:cellulose synthase/poly-beta-1,6-N-acetylglucosamine synthase-like glycosyltransferase